MPEHPTLDARPDRIDYRDLPYRAPLVSLPDRYPSNRFIEEHFDDYERADLLLDQGQEGACTGFGLAAVINFLFWKQAIEADDGDGPSVLRVSPRMLYQMARIYDEWAGEDYEGSSCRGAMKGWHRHGACSDEIWPYADNEFIEPSPGWQHDAATRPLGAYYRVEKNSIADLQAAIHEVGAIYVSAIVTRGWTIAMERPADELLPVIKGRAQDIGGHAFALVGYTPSGFIVQNSWGPDWGRRGFAILSYGDWVRRGQDAWTAVMGAPMRVDTSRELPATRSRTTLRDLVAGKGDWAWQPLRSMGTAEAVTDRPTAECTQPLAEHEALGHTVVLGNDGKPLNRFLDLGDARRALDRVLRELPADWFASSRSRKLAIYAHGGLNDEEASVKRTRIMAPYFLANNVYPVFVTWRTGFLESIQGMLEDVVGRFFAPDRVEPAGGWLEGWREQVEEAKDRSIEVASEHMLVKPVWSQMKQNAAAARQAGAGLPLLADGLGELRREVDDLEIHLVGHSAGSLILGHLLDRFGTNGLTVATCTLYAPACTVDFARAHYRKAVTGDVLAAGGLHVDLLSDERERGDSVGPYGKSLLYLVSRALEDVHKTPLLGMEGTWDPDVGDERTWHDGSRSGLRAWRDFADDAGLKRPNVLRQREVSDGVGTIPLAHGSFDNDVEVVAATLRRIRNAALLEEIGSLRGF